MERFKQKRWNLSDVLASSEGKQFEDFLQGLESELKEFEELRPNLESLDRIGLEKAFALQEKIIGRVVKLSEYGRMAFAADTQSEKAKAFRQKSEELAVRANNRLQFFNLWLGKLNNSKAEEVTPKNKDYRARVTELREQSRYDLNEKAEEVAALKDLSGKYAWEALYDTTTSAFQFTIRDGHKTLRKRNGKVKRLENEELNSLITGPSLKLASLAYRARFGKYAANGKLLFDIYSNISKDWDNEAGLRGFATPISSRNVENGIEDEAVEALLSVVQKNNGVFQRLFRIKARLLGIDKLSRYNLYNKLKAVPKKKMDYSDAVDLVLGTFDKFDKRFCDLARQVFEKDHVDAEIRAGKRSGAFCDPWSAKDAPYILLNYIGTLESVSAIAHESGHAIHSLLAAEHPILDAETGTPHSSGLPLAETASIFGEMILNDRLLATSADSKVKRSILLRELEGAYAAIARQAYFVIFEKRAHEAIKKGSSAEELSDMYYKTIQEQFGDAMSIPKEFRWEWSYIPHIFHTPFYCYAYSFGSLLTYAMYDRYRKNPDKTRDEMVKLLAYGGSKKPSEILNELGIDIKSEAFWQSGFDVLSKRVSELEKLI